MKTYEIVYIRRYDGNTVEDIKRTGKRVHISEAIEGAPVLLMSADSPDYVTITSALDKYIQVPNGDVALLTNHPNVENLAPQGE